MSDLTTNDAQCDLIPSMFIFAWEKATTLLHYSWRVQHRDFSSMWMKDWSCWSLIVNHGCSGSSHTDQHRQSFVNSSFKHKQKSPMHQFLIFEDQNLFPQIDALFAVSSLIVLDWFLACFYISKKKESEFMPHTKRFIYWVNVISLIVMWYRRQ